MDQSRRAHKTRAQGHPKPSGKNYFTAKTSKNQNFCIIEPTQKFLSQKFSLEYTKQIPPLQISISLQVQRIFHAVFCFEMEFS